MVGASRAAKPADALDHERRAREQRAGGAGGDEAVRLSVAQEVQSHGERGILLLLEGRRGIVADLHDLLGVGDLDALRDLLAAGLPQLAQDVRRAAGENDLRAVFLAGSSARTGCREGRNRAHRVKMIFMAFLLYCLEDVSRRLSMISSERRESSAFLLRFPLDAAAEAGAA